MGHPDGAHTHGGGGSGLGGLALVVLGAVVVASVAGPVVAAVAELVRLVLIVAAVVLGVAVLGAGGVLAYRLRRGRPDARPVEGQATPGLPPPSQALPAPTPRAIEQPGSVHLHLHGITAEEVAEILRRQAGQ